jgi:uncharacterized protein (DUF983 family)
MDKPPDNGRKPFLRVRHADLAVASDEPGALARLCPACKRGTLGVRRDAATMRIASVDQCLLCGQRVRYTDAADLREKDWA